MTSKKLPAAMPNITPEGNLARYLDEIRNFPMLSAKEEYDLAKDWKDKGNIEAAHKLVTSHLRLVAKIAMGYRGYGLPMGELIAEGNLGMMHAVKRSEPEKGLPAVHLCHVVDQGKHSGIYPAVVVARQNRHHRRTEEAVFQPAPHQGADQGHR